MNSIYVFVLDQRTGWNQGADYVQGFKKCVILKYCEAKQCATISQDFSFFYFYISQPTKSWFIISQNYVFKANFSTILTKQNPPKCRNFKRQISQTGNLKL